MKVDADTGDDHPYSSECAAGLASALRLAVARITRRLRQAHAVGDVSLSGVSVLARLAADGPASPGSLADLERVRPQAMATTLAVLEQRGLLRRTPDPTDGRRSIVTVTDDGRAMLAARRSESVQRLADVLDEFTPQERATLAAALPLLDRLAERL
ncbi:MarR family winged helix-turn-helix transcriptional regulator [Streptomyces sp. NBC_00996]|uniref:MarR family winged helix-turn-helix transcriptional regulator n=1 Tax=Streptomyces sp. NBC_00996 TaxID=2903710 RepID=UPI0038647854|nr:MarR family transcriptional regulator [Streptomyces sp. NBC_00996]